MKGIPVAILALLFLCACRTSEKQVVEMDQWWNVDFAKNYCATRGDSSEICKTNAELGLREFESRLATAIAAEPACNQVRYVSHIKSNLSNDKKLMAAWSLSLDYDYQRDEKQAWKIIHSPDDSNPQAYGYGEGSGTPSEVAKDICNFVSSRGGRVE